jgi:hypothetical protein
VTRAGEAAAGLSLELRLLDGGTWSTRATTLTGPDGRYSFTGVPALSLGQEYRVRYLNTTDAPNPGPGHLWSWLANKLVDYSAGATVAGGDFDVSDVSLSSPIAGASVTLPAQFCWTPRNVLTDNYALALWSSDKNEGAATGYLGRAACVTLTGVPADWPSGGQYLWWVLVFEGENPEATPYNSGSSYGDRLVTLHFSAASSGPDGGELLHPIPEGPARGR